MARDGWLDLASGQQSIPPQLCLCCLSHVVAVQDEIVYFLGIKYRVHMSLLALSQKPKTGAANVGSG